MNNVMVLGKENLFCQFKIISKILSSYKQINKYWVATHGNQRNTYEMTSLTRYSSYCHFKPKYYSTNLEMLRVIEVNNFYRDDIFAHG